MSASSTRRTKCSSGLQHSTSADVNYLVLPLVIVLVTSLLASLALPLGPLLRSMPPLRAYALDIAGSMLGIVAFAVMSFLGWTPTAWFTILAVLLLLLALGTGISPGRRSAASRCYSSSSPRSWPSARTRTSGRRITGSRGGIETGRQVSLRPEDGDTPWFLSVDGIPHQAMVGSEEAAESDLHRQVYAWFPGRRSIGRDHRRRDRHRYITGARDGRRARGGGRDRSTTRPHRRRVPSGPASTTTLVSP